MSSKKKKMDLLKDFENLLMLERRPVGVYFGFDNSEFCDLDLAVPRRIYYCSAVSLASRGRGLILTKSSIICSAARRHLGFEEVSNLSHIASEFARLGAYADKNASQIALIKAPVVKDKPDYLIVAPLDFFIEKEINPDVAIFVTNPCSAMRIVQGWNFRRGYFPQSEFFAMQAVCGELTARTYATGNPSLSLFCSGARHFGRFKESEVAVSVGKDDLFLVIEGVIETANVFEDDERKRTIIEIDPKHRKKLLFRDSYIYK